MNRGAFRAFGRIVVAATLAALFPFVSPAFAQDAKPAARPRRRGQSRRPSTPRRASAATRRSRRSTTAESTRASAATPATTARRRTWPTSSKRPTTKTDLANCGGCHQNQYKSYAQMDWHRTARFEKKQTTGPAPDPAYDLLMSPHGFTREHNLPRGHTFALLDQFVVDRAFGGRFGTKETWRYLAGTGDFKVWDVAVDLYPDNTEQKVFRPGTAAAANPVCLSCKTQDHILDWAYMGDPVPTAKWSRTSKVVELAKASNHSLNCIFCHDPHAAKPRIVRDALIDAVQRTDGPPTLYSQDTRKTKVDVRDIGVRGYTRKIGMLERYDGKLQCGQCHVEYNCNPGFDPNTGEAIPMADRRTNYFPFVDVNNILKAYDRIKFRDFRNQFTGAALWKAQHPDVETYYNSKHEKAGVDCAPCHMPKVKDAKTGKFYTSHWQTNPEELPEGDLPAVPLAVGREAGALRDRVDGRALPGQGPQCRVLARAADRQVRAGAARRRARGRAQGGAREARRRARELGMVDGRQRRVVPQPGPRQGVAREVGRRRRRTASRSSTTR